MGWFGRAADGRRELPLYTLISLIVRGRVPESPHSTAPFPAAPRRRAYNVPGREDLETALGLAVLVQGANKAVLFDTGPDGPLLLGNLRSLGIDPSTVDAVFLSHDHRDHTGGMRSFLEVNPDITVYLLPSFSAEVKTATTHRAWARFSTSRT